MLQEDRLGGKYKIEPKVTLEMIQLIAGFKAFHSAISKMNFDIEEVISSNFLHQFLISNTPRIEKEV